MEDKALDISFDWLHSLGTGEKIAVYDARIDDKIRIIAPYKGKFYILFWLQLCRDGSICCGVRDLSAKKYAQGSIRSEDGRNTIDFNSLPDMKEADDCNRLRKMTFHSSGIIHGVKYGEITKRNPFYTLEDQEELFLALFKEPSHYELLSATPRKKDICILSEIPSGHPIFLQTFIAPKDKYRRICINQGVYQFTALLEYQGIPDIGDLILQMCFSFSDKADYPPYSFMIWPAQCTDSN